jgi:hypothetical protein
MSVEIITTLIASVLGVVVGAVANYLLTKKKVHAEIKKLEAETEKTKIEAAKLSTELDKLSSQGDVSSINVDQPLTYPFVERFTKSGLAQAYRIPVDNSTRDQRTKELIVEEMAGSKKFRLAANSGYSYLNPNGKVWVEANLGNLITKGEADIIVVLESPFASFAVTRAIANKVDHHHWQEKQNPEDLIELLQYPNVSIRVTEEAVNCSLFMTSKAVLYDPYLWALFSPHSRTENKFWVFEFDRVSEPQHDCYGLLEKHFDFLFHYSTPIEEVLHTPEVGSQPKYGKDFYYFFKKNPDLALNKYNSLTKKFQTSIRARLSMEQQR